MKWMLDLKFEKPGTLIHHSEPILLMGSCFTGNIGEALAKRYFQTIINPCGIVFDPDSLARHVHRAILNTPVEESMLIKYNERYQSLQFHSDFSDLEKDKALRKMNAAIHELRTGLNHAKHFIITLGSSFVYRYHSSMERVANCHQFPADNFEKEMLRADEITELLEKMIHEVREFNPGIHFIFTISPVRHSRDGVVANNRSKAQLIEAVSRVVDRTDSCDYFPAYEYVIDVLRDYRWYDIDLVHPNYAATDAVFEQFCKVCLDEWTQAQLKDLLQLKQAKEHRPRFPETEAHRKFLAQMLEKESAMKEIMPWIKID